MHFNDYLKTLQKKGFGAFTLAQLMHDLHLSKGAALNAVYRKTQSGDLISPAKGFYVIVPPEHQAYGSIPAEDLVPLLMEHLQADYYVSLLSAAALYGATHQKPKHFQIVTNRRISHPMQFGQIKIEAAYKAQLTNLPIENKAVKTGYLKVAKRELVIFDLLHYPARAGGLNHIATVLSEFLPAFSQTVCSHRASQSEKVTSKMHFDTYLQLLDFAKTSSDRAWIQRMGFILEKIDPLKPVKLLPIVQLFQEYLQQKPLRFVPLAPHLAYKKRRRHHRWGVIENTKIESDL